MAILPCEPYEVNQAMARSHRMYEEYRRNTRCLDCPNNRHHDYPIMDGKITASYCSLDGQWLTPDLYRSTIAEMGCEP